MAPPRLAPAGSSRAIAAEEVTSQQGPGFLAKLKTWVARGECEILRASAPPAHEHTLARRGRRAKHQERATGEQATQGQELRRRC